MSSVKSKECAVRGAPCEGPPVLYLYLVVLSALLFVASSSWAAPTQERSPGKDRGPAAALESGGGLAEAASTVANWLAAAFPRVEALVIGFEGDQVLIDRGAADGVMQGLELEVVSEGNEFRHPLTDEVLGRLDKELGRLRILQVRDRYAVAAITKRAEGAEIRKGDRVRVSMARMIVAFPTVDVEGVRGVSARSVAKNLAAALVRTGRFELIEERQLRSMLLADKELTGAELAAPRILKQLAERGQAQALFLGRLTPSATGASLNVQVYSTLTGNPLVLATAQVPSADAAEDQARPPSPPARADHSSDSQRAGSVPSVISPVRALNGPSSVLRPSEGFQLGAVFDRPMQALAAADLDGDGKTELLLAAADRIAAYRIDGRRLTPLAEHLLNDKGTVAVLEAADVTGDGRAEVILTLMHKGRYHAIVLQWLDGKLAPVFEANDLVLRALSRDGQAAQLFGQEVLPGYHAPKTIRQYAWDGRTFNPGTTGDVPPGLPLLGLWLADLGGNGDTRLLTLRDGAVLEVRSQAGEVVSAYRDGGRLLPSTRHASPRILVESVGKGGRAEIILGREHRTGVRWLGWLAGAKAASVTALQWDGTKFQEVWESPPSEGALADYAVVDLGAKAGRYLALLVVKQGTLGFSATSEIQAFRLQ